MKRNKLKTRWKNVKSRHIGKRFFSDEIGDFYKIKKVQVCSIYSKNASHGIDSKWNHWFIRDRVFIKTDKGLKYIVPYFWLMSNSVTENGKKAMEE